MTNQNNAAQLVLTDEELREIQGTHLVTIRSREALIASVIVAGRAIEQAVLSKLRAPVADESPMAKMAEALREKARQEQRAYQDRRAQATEWGPMPVGTEADDPSALAALADGLESIVGNENAALAAAIIRRMASAKTMTLSKFCAEADRLGLTAEVLATQLAALPEFADCLPEDDGHCESCIGNKCVTGPKCVTLGLDSTVAGEAVAHAVISYGRIQRLVVNEESAHEYAEQQRLNAEAAGWDAKAHVRPLVYGDAAPQASADAGEAQGWSGWACQYPNKLPRLYGAKEIAELNCDPANGDRVLFLSEDAAPQASAEPATYTTRPGESVMGIALRELGDEKAWRHILACNPQFADLLPHEYFPVGTVLTLPQADKDGGQWEPQTPEQIAAAMRNMARSEGFDWPEPDDGQQREGGSHENA
ncbi:LysM peptidoglycan-binding domain-containing protein [Achromobacter xylosoxidans]|uniref:LysM peptidoglycan-binding domain-containing protein n=1 Tax=Alcaligenes xylosoxydans xylosoxydans TaxID=85698 RepID=UPI0021BEB351|nr:hypothetical protein [Achromobacter xylosoxidans]UXL06438.1 hypothetical protein N4T34_06950 [Achromobacter xylosoxidans]